MSVHLFGKIGSAIISTASIDQSFRFVLFLSGIKVSSIQLNSIFFIGFSSSPSPWQLQHPYRPSNSWSKGWPQKWQGVFNLRRRLRARIPSCCFWQKLDGSILPYHLENLGLKSLCQNVVRRFAECPFLTAVLKTKRIVTVAFAKRYAV